MEEKRWSGRQRQREEDSEGLNSRMREVPHLESSVDEPVIVWGEL